MIEPFAILMHSSEVIVGNHIKLNSSLPLLTSLLWKAY